MLIYIETKNNISHFKKNKYAYYKSNNRILCFSSGLLRCINKGLIKLKTKIYTILRRSTINVVINIVKAGFYNDDSLRFLLVNNKLIKADKLSQSGVYQFN